MPRARIPPPWLPQQRKIAARHARFVRATKQQPSPTPSFLPISRYKPDPAMLASLMRAWATKPPMTTRKRAILAMLDKGCVATPSPQA